MDVRLYTLSCCLSLTRFSKNMYVASNMLQVIIVINITLIIIIIYYVLIVGMALSGFYTVLILGIKMFSVIGIRNNDDKVSMKPH